MAGFHRKSWSDARRRLACRLAFAALVALPAILVARRLMTPHDPVRLLAPLAEIAGLNATADRLETPRPGAIVLHGLRIPLADGGKLELPRVLWNRGTTDEVFVMDTVRLDAAALTALLAEAARAIRPANGDDPAESVFRLRCERVEVERAAGKDEAIAELVLAPLELVVVRSATASRCLITFQRVGGEPCPPVEIVLERQATGSTSTTSWLRVSTGQTWLPAGLFAALAPPLRQLGGSAKLGGEWTCQWNDDEAAAGFCKGQLVDVDLSAVGRMLERKLSGTGSLFVDRLEWSAGRIDRLQATVAAERGQFGAGWEPFLERSGWLQFDSPNGGEFDHLQFRLSVDQGQVLVCPRLENGVGTIIAWTEQADGAQSVIESNPAGRASSLHQFASGLFPVSAHPAANSPGLGNQAIAFLDHFRLDENAVSAPADAVRVAGGEPVEASQR